MTIRKLIKNFIELLLKYWYSFFILTNKIFNKNNYIYLKNIVLSNNILILIKYIIILINLTFNNKFNKYFQTNFKKIFFIKTFYNSLNIFSFLIFLKKLNIYKKNKFNKKYLLNFFKFILLKIFYFSKKYLYTINHRRIALNYFYFCLLTGLNGGFLALLIRLELSHPGSSFFKGNMLLYLQVITSHGLIMIFFVVVPLIFGFFGNFLLPLHIGSKDVAFPRLNSIGFWILPVGYLIILRAAFLRPQLWKRRAYNSKTWFNIKNYQIEKKYNNLQELEKFNINEINLKKKNIFNDNEINYNIPTNEDFLPINKPLNMLSFKNDEETIKSYKNFLIYTEFFSENFWTNILKNLWNGNRAKKLGVNDYSWKQYIEKGCGNTKTTTGWTFITPFTSDLRFSNKGAIDYLLIAVIFAGITTTLTFTNLLVTRRIMSMPGLESRRFLIPFLTISILLVLRFLAIITPVLGSSIFMIFTDRFWSTTFFDFSYGGDPILSQHLFWFFGHPEVYVLIIPTFGIINMVLPFSAYRRVTSKQHMIWAVYAMGIMGFLVWGHHMYLVGLDHKSRAIYSTITIMISLPATIKIISWSLSILNSSIKGSYLTFASLSYILFFLVSGLTGMWLSHICLNTNLHDTYYVIAHFHLMLSATTLMGLFIGVYYYFYTFFNTTLSTTYVWLHLINYSIGQWCTFLPQFYLGIAGMPRRIHDYPNIFAGWNGFSTAGYIITLIGVFSFFLVLFDSNFNLKLKTNYQLLPRINNKGTYLGILFIKLKRLN